MNELTHRCAGPGERSAEVDGLHLEVAGLDVCLTAPENVLAVIDRMLAHVSHTWSGSGVPATIDVALDAQAWRIAGSHADACKALDAASSLPQVAGAAISAMLADLAHARDIIVWRAAVVEKDGAALALIGDDWESCITLAAHLHTRGWRLLGSDRALVVRDTLAVAPYRKSLYATSSCAAAFPQQYRRAIEASPWHSVQDVIGFYAIDPQLVAGAPAWADSARVRAILRADGRYAARPSIETIDDVGSALDALRLGEKLAHEVNAARLVLGSFIETADAVESWFA